MGVDYRLVSCEFANAGHGAGILVAGQIYSSDKMFGKLVSVLDLLKDWDRSRARIAAWINDGALSGGVALSQVKLEAPVQYPQHLFCAGANYWDHLQEMAAHVKETTGKAPNLEKAPEPWLFLKTTQGTIVGDGHRVRLPKFSTMVDWEAELGVVIARPTREISEKDALSAVAGYLIVNDLSARDYIRREGSPFVYDWIGQKCWDDAAPMGPWLTPTECVADPNNLDIKLWVNGALKQSSNSGKMVHSIAEQIAYLSRHVTLNPGDIIATGTPAGVGMARKEFLKPGDDVKIEIAGLGTLTNTMIAS